MKKVVKWFKKYQFILFSFLVSFIFLSITSKNSFLYPLNDWVDANAFFTVGKSLMNGVIPYKDIFEQKGILLYLIYGLGYLISNKSFYGVFIIEVAFFTIFLYFVSKIVRLFLNSKFVYIILPILSFLITTSVAFTHGGSAEEFCLPMFAFSLYYYLKHFKEKELTGKILILNGMMAGCVFLIKYTLLGFWIAFMMFIFFDLIIKKKYKEAFLDCIYFLIGMFIPIFLALIYFLLTNSLKEFIDCYFLINMTAYNETDLGLVVKILEIYDGVIRSLLNNGLLVFFSILLIPLFISNLKISKYTKFSLVGMCLITALGLFWGMHFYRYYMLPMFIFIVISLIGCVIYFERFLNKFCFSKFKWIIFSILYILLVILTYLNANYKDMILMSKDNMFQFKYASYINNYDKPTMLNMGYLDGGLYTTTGIIPNTRFFEVQNIPYDKYPDNLDDMRENVINKKVDFILYYTRKDIDYVKEHDGYIFDNYELVYDDSYLFENDSYTAFLFQLKDL